MRLGQLCRKLGSHLLRQLLKEILAKIKTNPDAIDADDVYYVLDVIDIVIDRAVFGVPAHEDRIYADHTPALTNHPELLVADVALDVVKLPHVRV